MKQGKAEEGAGEADRFCEEIEFAAQNDELAANVTYSLAVIAPKVSDSLEVGDSCSMSHISSTLRYASPSSADWTGSGSSSRRCKV